MRFHVEPALFFVAACISMLAFAGGQLVRFPGDGLDLEGQLSFLEGHGLLPAVVMLHGCKRAFGIEKAT